MKNKYFAAILLAGTLALAMPVHSFAASLGLSIALPTLQASISSIDYLEFGPDGDLSTFGAGVDITDGVSPVGVTGLGFGIGFSLANPIIGATGGFDVTDQNGLFLTGNLIAVGFSDDVIELQFGSLSGAGAGSFGSTVLARLAFGDPLGPNPFISLVDGEFYSASITISNVSAVPLPAALPLFLSALFGFGWIGKRSRKK